MNLIFLLIFFAAVLDGLLAGIGLQKLFVELPARKKIGVVAFSDYSRASDLMNGVYLYPSFAIGGVLLKVLAFVFILRSNYDLGVTFPLGLAVVFGIGVLIMTIFAAPQMFKIGKTENKKELLSPLLEKFMTYSYPRAVFMGLQFLTTLWVLAMLK
jgi:hypothetical protein